MSSSTALRISNETRRGVASAQRVVSASEVSPFTGAAETFALRKQYHVMRQFTAHIRPDAQILQTADPETVAAYDPRTNTTTIVFSNGEASGDAKVYDLLDREPLYTRLIRTTDGPAYSVKANLFVAERG